MSSQSFRILAVDDNPDNLILLQTVLEAEGFVVDIAASAPIALNKIKTSPPDLVLLDVMMPEMNGYEVIEQIRQDQTLPEIPIVLVSAHSSVDVHYGMTLGANGFLRKPIDFDLLLNVVDCNLSTMAKMLLPPS